MAKGKKELKKNNYTKIIIVLGILILLIIVFLTIKATITANLIKQQEEQEKQKQKEMSNYKDWLVENCKCIEQNITLCPKNYKLVGSVCRNETLKTFTNQLLACSKYNCTEEIRELTREYYE